MGRQGALNKDRRTAFIQVRCATEYKERVVKLAKRVGYQDVTGMIEALIERERQRVGDEPFPPR